LGHWLLRYSQNSGGGGGGGGGGGVWFGVNSTAASDETLKSDRAV